MQLEKWQDRVDNQYEYIWNTAYLPAGDYVIEVSFSIDNSSFAKPPPGSIHISKPLAEDIVDNRMVRCREKGITTFDECKIFLALLSSCNEAKTGDYKNCDLYELLKKLPVECFDAEKMNQAECRNYLFSAALPQECRDQNIKNQDECNKFLTEKYSKDECISHSIYSENTCKKYLFEKYRDMQNQNSSLP